MKNLLLLALVAVALCVAASCGGNYVGTVADIESPVEPETEEPPPEQEVEELYEHGERPEPAPPLVTEEGIVWLVAPMHEYYGLAFCTECGGLVDSQHRIICVTTGEILGWGGHGRSSGRPIYVFDPELNLFGEAQFGWGYDHDPIGMHPLDEAISRFGLGGFYVVQTVDSTKRSYWNNSRYFEGAELQEWSLDSDAFLGTFAVMFNGEFVTDFIFDGGLHPEWWGGLWNAQFNSVAVRLNGMWGTIDRNGDVSIPFVFDYIRQFDENRIVAVLEDNAGLLDRYGNTLVPFSFDDIYHFGETFYSLWIAAIYSGQHGLINDTGNTIMPFLFDHLFDIGNGTAFAKYNGLYGIIDLTQTIANTTGWQPNGDDNE